MIKIKDISEGLRIQNPYKNKQGKLTARHQTTHHVWMILWDNGEIEELTNSDLRDLWKVENNS